MTMKVNNLNKARGEIYNEIKKYVSLNGWSDEILKEVSKKSNFSYAEILVLFPNGYIELLNMYLNEINNKMTIESKKLNLIHLKVHQRIRELIILRLNIMSLEKKLISKTYFHLFLPNNFKFSSKALYKSVDQIWFVAKDNSTDFNFYSKRAILAWIYNLVILHFINNDNIEETINLLDKHLKIVSQIPLFKNKLQKIFKTFPSLLKFFLNKSTVKQ